jgi:hypothetical protein
MNHTSNNLSPTCGATTGKAHRAEQLDGFLCPAPTGAGR